MSCTSAKNVDGEDNYEYSKSLSCLKIIDLTVENSKVFEGYLVQHRIR